MFMNDSHTPLYQDLAQGYEKVRQSLADGMLCEQRVSDLVQEALQGSPEPYQALGVLGALAEEEALRGKAVSWDSKVSGESNAPFFFFDG